MRRLLIACTLWSLVGCAPVPRVVLPGTRVEDDARVTAILAAHPLADGENIQALPLARTESCSYHLIQIRDRERPHLHANHDLAVTLLRGEGRLYLRGAPHAMRRGDVAVVPRGTPHYFVNAGTHPAAAFVTFAPPYDGKDQVPVE